tara:strand:+ start:3129 stop:4163 length:1035 start_codon:yes stop_codon:yes gene_type:complete
MNEKQHEQFIEDYGEVYNQYLFQVPIEDIVYNDKSQTRAKGHVTGKQKAIGRSIKADGQLAPITVRRLASGKFLGLDGLTRIGGAHEENLETLMVSTLENEYLNLSQDDMQDFIDSANDHPPSSPSTTDDIEDQVRKRVESGAFDRGAGCTYQQHKKAWMKHAVDKIYSLNKRSGRSKESISNTVSKVLNGTIVSRMKNYTKGAVNDSESAVCFVKKNNSFSWSPKQGASGTKDNDVACHLVYCLQTLRNKIGSIWEEIHRGECLNHVVVVWYDALAGKESKDVVDFKKGVFEKVNKTTINGKKIGLVFLPQIKEGEYKEDLTKLEEHLSQDFLSQLRKSRKKK